jgi:hypothetical protein
MSQEIEELIKMATQLSNRLDRMAQDECSFASEICHFLEKTSWETFKLSEDLEIIKSYVGG